MSDTTFPKTSCSFSQVLLTCLPICVFIDVEILALQKLKYLSLGYLCEFVYKLYQMSDRPFKHLVLTMYHETNHLPLHFLVKWPCIIETLLYEMHVPHNILYDAIKMATCLLDHVSSSPLGVVVPLHHIFLHAPLFSLRPCVLGIRCLFKTRLHLSLNLLLMTSKEYSLVILTLKRDIEFIYLIRGIESLLMTSASRKTSPSSHHTSLQHWVFP